MSANAVYLFTGPNEDHREITKRLLQLQIYAVKSIDSFDEIPRESRELLVLNYNAIGGEELVSVFQAARALPKARILVAANQIPIAVYKKIVELENAFTLQKPFSRSCLNGVLSKMLVEETDSRASPSTRFTSHQPVRFVVQRTGLLIHSHMTNYSGTGAYLEYRGISLKIGDDLEIGLDSKDFDHRGERIRFPARVVWISKGLPDKSPGVGVQFVKLAESKSA